MANKRITDDEASKLQTISKRILTCEKSYEDHFQELFGKILKVPPIEKMTKLKVSDSKQAKRLLINEY